MERKTVYTCFCTDIIHEGHMKIIRKCASLGRVVVGVLCDSEMVRYNRFPIKSEKERMEMLRKVPEIDSVMLQKTIAYDDIITQVRPDYVVHGNNWDQPGMTYIKSNILSLLQEYGGELVEVPYTYNPEIQKIDKQMNENLAMPEFRRGRLRKILNLVPVVKTIEVHSGLTGLIAEKTIVENGGGD